MMDLKEINKYMNNKHNENQEECLVCSSFNRFISHVKDGVSVQKAFEHVVAELADNLADEAYQDGFKDGQESEQIDDVDTYRSGFIAGYKEAMQDVAKQANRVIDGIDESLEHGCCICEDKDACSNCPDEINCETCDCDGI